MIDDFTSSPQFLIHMLDCGMTHTWGTSAMGERTSSMVAKRNCCLIREWWGANEEALIVIEEVVHPS